MGIGNDIGKLSVGMIVVMKNAQGSLIVDGVPIRWCQVIQYRNETMRTMIVTTVTTVAVSLYVVFLYIVMSWIMGLSIARIHGQLYRRLGKIKFPRIITVRILQYQMLRQCALDGLYQRGEMRTLVQIGCQKDRRIASTGGRRNVSSIGVIGLAGFGSGRCQRSSSSCCCRSACGRDHQSRRQRMVC